MHNNGDDDDDHDNDHDGYCVVFLFDYFFCLW